MLEAMKALKGALAPGTRLLGLDVGSKTIGLALSDERLRVATAFDTLGRGKAAEDGARLAAVIAEHGVGGLVIGLPLNMDGGEGPRCQSVRQFAANMEPHLAVPAAFWDERLSTAAVERLLIDEADMSRRRRRQVIDKMAAAYILQGALDALAAAEEGAAGGGAAA